jgi:hypothetical protein
LALNAVTVALYVLGRDSLGAPPLTHAGRALAWWHERGAVLATFALLREALLVVGCYLGVLWTVALAAAWWRDGRPMRVLCRCRLPGASGVAQAVLGVSALGAVTIANAGPSFAIGSEGGSHATSTLPSEPAARAPVLRYAGAIAIPVFRFVAPSRSAGGAHHRGRPALSGSPRRQPLRPPGAPAVHRGPVATPAPATGEPAASVHQAGTWTVRLGDDLWSIAEATLTRAWAHPPAPPDLARYWWLVVQINRAALPNPADPSLLFPGDQIVLPAPPAAPR